MSRCRHCRRDIDPHTSTFEVPANGLHGDLVFCSVDCLDDYYTARQPEQES
ncbi:MAG TPA: hypothetical protein VFJ14_17835 [Nocardioidaceae bacterium]|nr:hypothetical protein [Nocardioidaceae bacterium]